MRTHPPPGCDVCCIILSWSLLRRWSSGARVGGLPMACCRAHVPAPCSAPAPQPARGRPRRCTTSSMRRCRRWLSAATHVLGAAWLCTPCAGTVAQACGASRAALGVGRVMVQRTAGCASHASHPGRGVRFAGQQPYGEAGCLTTCGVHCTSARRGRQPPAGGSACSPAMAWEYALGSTLTTASGALWL